MAYLLFTTVAAAGEKKAHGGPCQSVVDLPASSSLHGQSPKQTLSDLPGPRFGLPLIITFAFIECPLLPSASPPPQSPDDPRLVSFFLLTHWLRPRRQPPIQHSIAPFLMQPGSNVTIVAHLFHTKNLGPSSINQPRPLPPTAGTTGSLGSAFSSCLCPPLACASVAQPWYQYPSFPIPEK